LPLGAKLRISAHFLEFGQTSVQIPPRAKESAKSQSPTQKYEDDKLDPEKNDFFFISCDNVFVLDSVTRLAKMSPFGKFSFQIRTNFVLRCMSQLKKYITISQFFPT
jgi:hypothetical protein